MIGEYHVVCFCIHATSMIGKNNNYRLYTVILKYELGLSVNGVWQWLMIGKRMITTINYGIPTLRQNNIPRMKYFNQYWNLKNEVYTCTRTSKKHVTWRCYYESMLKYLARYYICKWLGHHQIFNPSFCPLRCRPDEPDCT